MRYHTGVPIGQGGMSQVLEAWDPVLERTVALKLLQRDDPELVERMLREARAQALVDHPAVCRVFDVGWVEGRPYIAMERVRGCTLAGAASTMTLEQKVALMKTVAEAVDAAHQVGLVHRDLKPGNILVETTSEAPRPFVVDFGIAQRREVEGLTLTGQIVGTPGYMSPEQARGEVHTLDPRSDVFQLGIVLYELLGGRRPFQGESQVETLIQILERDPPPLRRVAPGLPADLEAITTRCLEKDAARRYATAAALAEDLVRYLAGEPPRAHPVGPLGRLERRARRRPWITAGLVFGVVVMVTLTGLWWSARRQAAERARLAQRFGQRIEAMAAQLRLAHLAPLHDTTPTHQRLRRQLAAMEREVAVLEAPLRPVGQAALGRGYLALGEAERAFPHLQAAWGAAQRRKRRNPRPAPAELAASLGRVWAERYRLALDQTEEAGTGELHRAALARARERFRTPALELLAAARRSAGRDGEGGSSLLAARLAWIEGRWDEARARGHRTLTEHPWLYEAALVAGDAARGRAAEERARGDRQALEEWLAKAATDYRRAVAVGRSDGAAWERLCRLEGQRLEAAIYEVGSSGARPDEPWRAAAEACGKALVAEPERASARILLAALHNQWARTLAERGEDPTPALNRALDAASRALARSPANPGLQAAALRRRGDAWSQRAEWQRQQGEDPVAALAAAIADLERAVRRAPDDPGAFNSLGLAHWERAEYITRRGGDPGTALAVAIATFRRAVQLLPEYHHGWSNLGTLHRLEAQWHIRQGRDPATSFAASVTAFERALSAAPTNAYAQNNLGSLHLEIGWHLLDHDPAATRRATVDPAVAFRRALEYYDRALEVRPDWAFPYFNQGLAWRGLATTALAHEEDPTDALNRGEQAFERGLSLRDDLAMAHLEAARLPLVAVRDALRKPVRPERARESLEQATARVAAARRLDPDLPFLWQITAELELLRGRTALAAAPGKRESARTAFARSATALERARSHLGNDPEVRRLGEELEGWRRRLQPPG